MVYVPEEAARTALGMARAVSRGDNDGLHHLWDASERPGEVAQTLAVLVANIVGRLCEATGRPPEYFYNELQAGLETGPAEES